MKNKILKDFDIYIKISKEEILEKTMANIKQDYECYVVYDENILASEHGEINKSFEILSDKIADGIKSVVIYKDFDRFVIVYNDFWDSHHKSIILQLENSEEENLKKIKRLLNIVKVFCMGFSHKIFFVNDNTEEALSISKIVNSMLKVEKQYSLDEIKIYVEECNYIENHLVKTKKIVLATFLALFVVVLLNFSLEYVLNYQKKSNLYDIAGKKEILDKYIDEAISMTDNNRELKRKAINEKIYCD